ncbi:Touch receptor neuron Mec-17 family protein [Spironucleus salmonicida]|uniref:Touch receptor neuron Mec-17 family protein n=1 Tax=Spironucleus salmonicida TaxID=348837 RepID=V6LUS0_9EUKA|nr:Touch receptor neuron Mec-17 family protein [Spironucleus salmonicida]|eukprot:EST44554.1 Touch receptor neuron Mec-17 family protein [Spironucleus salmonicida]
MQVPESFLQHSSLYIFRVAHDTYDTFTTPQKLEIKQLLSKIGQLSQTSQNHPKNLYDIAFLQRNHEYLILASNSLIIGFLKFGFKKLFQYGKNAQVHEMITPCLLDVFVIEENRKKSYFKYLIQGLEMATGFKFNAFAIDDPPKQFIQSINWKTTDQSSKFLQQIDAIESLGKAYKDMKRNAKLRKCELIDLSEPGAFICQTLKQFLDSKLQVKYDPFIAIDISNNNDNQVYDQSNLQNSPNQQSDVSGQISQQQSMLQSITKPEQIDQAEYNEFLIFREQKLRDKMQYYESNEKQRNVPARRIDEEKMGRQQRDIVSQPNRIRQQAEEFENFTPDVKQVEDVDLLRIKNQQYTPFQATQKQNPMRQPWGQQMQIKDQLKILQQDYAPVYQNTHHTHSHQIGYQGNDDDTYQRKNEYVTMDMVQTNTFPRRVPFDCKSHQTQRKASGRMW